MHYGFKKLQAMLAAKGVRDPGAVAASIGREKYGKKNMEQAAAGKRPLHEYDKRKKKYEKM